MNKTEIKRISGFLKPISKRTNSWIIGKDKQRIILLYHGISRRPQFNCVAQDLFKDQISWIKGKYSVVPLVEMVESLRFPNRYKSNLASITFDDGYVNFAELAVPVLKEFDCHATVFVPSGKVGGFNDWDKEGSRFYKMAIMSFEQLRELPERLVEVGSHGISHNGLDQLSFDEFTQEIVESRLRIEDGVGRAVRFFAYPFGIYPFKNLSKYYGNSAESLRPYVGACVARWGRYNSLKDIYTLRRVGIWDSDSFEDFVDKLEGNYDWLVIKEKVGRLYKSVRAWAMR